MELIELKNIKKDFNNNDKKISVLKDINIKFLNKGLYVIVGSSGEGKSTLLKIIAGLSLQTEGTFLFKGKKLEKDDCNMAMYRNIYVGFVFQNYQLIEGLTPLENVAFPLIIRGNKKIMAEERAYQLFVKFKLEKLIHQSVKTLSGGEKQRVAILRAMINNPSFYLLDEPSGALDSENTKYMMDMFKIISNDKLVIMVTHNLMLAKEYADTILFLKEGVIYES